MPDSVSTGEVSQLDPNAAPFRSASLLTDLNEIYIVNGKKRNGNKCKNLLGRNERIGLQKK